MRGASSLDPANEEHLIKYLGERFQLSCFPFTATAGRSPLTPTAHYMKPLDDLLHLSAFKSLRDF